MKIFYSILLFLCLPLWTMAQTSGQNYIVNSTAYQATRDPTSLNDANSNTTIQYFDGLGRPIETVQKGITPFNQDLVTYTEYDSVGREYKHWLPITSANSGAFVPQTTFATNSSGLYGGDTNPFGITEYEPSPLNRVTGQYGAGNAWYAATKKVQTDYGTNAGEVAYYFVNSSNQLQHTGSYAANSLYKTVMTDEDGKTTTEYKDNLGQVVMKQNDTDVKTYYVYDNFGRLRYVLPPLAADALTTAGIIADNTAALAQYAYLYKYDERGNNVVKRLPGCDSICMVYDKANRLILSQDGNQRAKATKQWTVIKYDALGRVIYTGYRNGNETRLQMKAILDPLVITELFDRSTTFYNTGYTCGYFIGEVKPLTVNYYDTYSFRCFQTAADTTKLIYTALNGYDIQYTNANGLLTGTRTYILDKSGSNYLTAVLYYDDRGRVVQTRATNHLGGYDYAYNHYDYAGKVRATYKIHNTATQIDVPETYTYDYDNAGRPTTTTYKIYNSQVVLTNNVYDELGRVQNTYRHGGTDTISYAYNIRNWTTMIKSGTFAEYLNYNTSANVAVTPCFNGNISSATYNYKGTYRDYNYWYDPLNRLLSGTAFQFSGSIPISAINTENFTYDKQGNIQTLTRQSGNTLIDDLAMAYSGNQVRSVTDSKGSQGLYDTKEYNNKANTTNEMSYDRNGNMTKDLDRDIVTIRYNLLNLPDTVQFKFGNQIINRYAADGRKLFTLYFTKKTQLSTPIDTGLVYNYVFNWNLMTQSGTDYIGNMEYSSSRSNSGKTYSLQRVHNPEGYANTFNSSYVSTNFFYFRRDHLGNTREVWQAPYTVYVSNNFVTPGTVVQRTQYYPSGLPWSEGYNPSLQEYKYNGKEFLEMNGYDTYDYGARGYYPALGSLPTVDPLCERAYDISPYVYCSNNPVNRIDPDGRADFWLNGKVVGNDGVSDQKIYAIKTTEKDYNGVAGAGLSRKDQRATVDFIKANSGNAEAFQNNGVAYTNSIGIESSADNRQAMVNEVSRDNGNGGKSAANNREYGGSIENEKVVAATPGAVANPKTDATANILLPSGVSTFHDHPSGSVVDAPPAGSYGGTTTTYSFTQSPSPIDINAAGTNTHYVFGRSAGVVYVYTANGIQAEIPMKQFVTPKK